MTDQDRIHQVEAVMLDKFQSEPFHSLYFLNNCRPRSWRYGGTCSDKVLSARQTLNELGFDARLHISFIGGVPSHRLLRIRLDERYWFADVGNGWPSVKAFPEDRPIEYWSYGIRYHSVLVGDRLEIHQFRRGRDILSTSIPVGPQHQGEVQSVIDARFERAYPFSRKLRFAQVVGDEFRFLRDHTLSVFKADGPPEDRELPTPIPAEALEELFDFDHRGFMTSAGLTELVTGVE